MKVIKSLVLFGFVAIGASSCFDPPDFPDDPQIDNATVYFGVTPDPSEFDSLVLSITFKDGNGDLGVDADKNSDPYHASNFFFANNGELDPVATFTGVTNETNPRIFTPILWPRDDQDGKLITLETRDEDPDYSFLPPDIFPYSCSNYVENTLYITEEHIHLLDASYNYNIVDTIDDVTPTLYKLEENFYTEYNPNQYNIMVEFQTLEGGDWVVFDWRERYCTTFDGRFPVLSDKTAPLEGTLRYSMKSSGFYSIFSTKTMRLKVQILDRGFNPSNFTYTKSFTLDQIKR